MLSSTRAHQFPICEKKARWEVTARGRLSGMDDEDVAAIRAVQPFTVVRKPTPLSRLRNLSNEDKHQVVTLLNPAVGSPHPVALTAGPLPPDMQLVPRRDVAEMLEAERYVGVPLDGTVPLVRVRITASGPNPDIGLVAKALSDLMLEDGGLVTQVIAEMATTVEQIINDFVKRWT